MPDKPLATSKMSLPTQLLCTVGLPGAFAGLAYSSPPTAALIPVLLSPTAFLVWKYQKIPQEEAGSADTAIWTYLGISTIGPLIAGSIQLPLIKAMFSSLFGSRSKDYMREMQRITLENLPADVLVTRKQMAWSPRYFLSIAIFSYVGAAIVEEAIKYLALRLAVRRTRPKHEREYLIYAAVAGLGYGTIENILVTYASFQTKESGTMIAVTLFERIIFASVGHTIMALLTGLRSIRRDSRGEKLAVWQVLAPAVIYHGTWDCILFALSAWNGNIGWIHPTDIGSVAFGVISVLALQSKAAWDVLRQFKELKVKACT